MRLLHTAIFIVIALAALGQQTVGVTLMEEGYTPGYTFFSPMGYQSAYLVDDCGFLVNEWERGNRPGLSGYITETGVMLRANKVDSPEFFQASTGGNVEIVDWDNNTLWSADFNTFEMIQHHDLRLLPSGNILFLGWERISPEQQIAYGRPPAEVSEPYLWGEFIYEITPIGQNDYDIVWEWHLQDHFVQDYDVSLPNYAEIQDEMGKVDINYLGPGAWGRDDWWHCNALDYNPTLDQILVNSRNNNEMWIIDHSTTTEEAAGSTGGNAGRGGQLLYRWGNPEAYGRGDGDNLRMYGSHGHHWIPDSLPNAGKIMYFNNGDDRPGGYYSTIEMVEPPLLADGYNYAQGQQMVYLPAEPEVVYKDPVDEFGFLSYYLSNAQQLPNGNIFINEGGSGRFFEVDESLNTLWQYISPVRFSGPVQQGDFISSNSVFRAYKLPSNYPGFAGLDLSVTDPIEGSAGNICGGVSTDDQSSIQVAMYFDMESSTLYAENHTGGDINVSIISAEGQLVVSTLLEQGKSSQCSLAELTSGVYVATLHSPSGVLSSKKIVRY